MILDLLGSFNVQYSNIFVRVNLRMKFLSGQLARNKSTKKTESRLFALHERCKTSPAVRSLNEASENGAAEEAGYQARGSSLINNPERTCIFLIGSTTAACLTVTEAEAFRQRGQRGPMHTCE